MYNETVARATSFFDFAERHGLALVKLHPKQKRPVGDDWTNLASKDRGAWEAWHAGGCNIGVHAGASGIATADIEVGRWEIAATWFRDEIGIEIPKPHVMSARDGHHLYFKLPESAGLTKLKFAWGELLVGKNQTVASPSFFDGTPEGKKSGWYRFYDLPDLHNGAPLLKLWRSKPETRVGTAKEAPPDFRPVDGMQAAHVLKMACITIAATEKGSGLNDVLNTQALKVGHYVGSGDIGYDVAFEDLYAACLEAGGDNPGKDKSTIARGLKDGMKEPALTAAEMFAGVDLTKIAAPPLAPEAKIVPRYLFETVSDLRTLPQAKWLVDGWFPETGVGLIYGDYASGKSFILFDLLLHLAYGLSEWHGVKLRGIPIYVLLIAREGATGFRGRIDAFKMHHGITDDTDRIVFMRSPVNFNELAGFEELKTAISASGRQFGVVGVDTVGRAIPGEDFNDAKSITRFMEHLQQLGEIGGGVAIGIHHVSKAGEAFGSVYFGASSDFMFEVVRDGDPKKDPLRRGKISCAKMKDGPDGWSRRLNYQAVADSLVLASVTEGMDLMGGAVAGRLTEKQELALRDAQDVIKERGQNGEVTAAQWREEMHRSGTILSDDPNPRTTYGRLRDALVKRELVFEENGMIRLTKLKAGGPLPEIPHRPVAL